MPNRLARLAAAFMITAACATGAAAQTTDQSAEQTGEPVAAPEAGLETVVATVNGEAVTLGEVLLVRAGLPEQYQNIPDPTLFEAIVEQLVNRTLLAQSAAKKDYGDSSLAKVRAAFDRRDFLANVELRDVVAGATGEEALRAAYDARIKDMAPETEVRASHILVAEKEKADELHAQLEEGADFAELAAEHGTDGTKTRGGDLGYFVMGDMVPEFAEAAFALEVGAFSAPVQTQFGWHLILLADKRERAAPSFEEMSGELAQEAADKAVEAAMTEMREAAEIVTPETAIDPALIRRDDLLTVK